MNIDDLRTSQRIQEVGNALGDLISDRVIIEGQTFVIQRPKNADHLRKEPALRALIADDEYSPVGTDLWPAARMLAKAILREAWPPGWEAVEIGCGLGLPGIAALSRGLRVTFSDYDPVALQFAAHNAQLNGYSDFQLLRLDWRNPPADITWPIVLASDLIYELRNVEPLFILIKHVLRQGGVCLLTDQDRVPSQSLRATLTRVGLSYTTQMIRAGEPGGRRMKGTLYRIACDE